MPTATSVRLVQQAEIRIDMPWDSITSNLYSSRRHRYSVGKIAHENPRARSASVCRSRRLQWRLDPMEIRTVSQHESDCVVPRTVSRSSNGAESYISYIPRTTSKWVTYSSKLVRTARASGSTTALFGSGPVNFCNRLAGASCPNRSYFRPHPYGGIGGPGEKEDTHCCETLHFPLGHSQVFTTLKSSQ